MKRKRTSKQREERKLKKEQEKEQEKESQSSDAKVSKTNSFVENRQGRKTSGVNNAGGRTGHRRTP